MQTLRTHLLRCQEEKAKKKRCSYFLAYHIRAHYVWRDFENRQGRVIDCIMCVWCFLCIAQCVAISHASPSFADLSSCRICYSEHVERVHRLIAWLNTQHLTGVVIIIAYADETWQAIALVKGNREVWNLKNFKGTRQERKTVDLTDNKLYGHGQIFGWCNKRNLINLFSQLRRRFFVKW